MIWNPYGDETMGYDKCTRPLPSCGYRTNARLSHFLAVSISCCPRLVLCCVIRTASECSGLPNHTQQPIYNMKLSKSR